MRAGPNAFAASCSFSAAVRLTIGSRVSTQHFRKHSASSLAISSDDIVCDSPEKRVMGTDLRLASATFAYVVATRPTPGRAA